MKVQIGNLDTGSRIVLTEVEGTSLSMGRYVVGKQIQDRSGHPLVEVKRPGSKSVYTYVPTDEEVYVG